MDRKIFKVPFTRNHIPKWMCPTCEKGVLQLENDSFISDESAASKGARGHDAWEPEWIEYVYTCFLRCSNNTCKEIVSSTGVGTVDWYEIRDHNGMPEQEWSDYFRAEYFQPHLKIFSIPMKTPIEVTEEIHQSFSLFFCNPDSASNHLRISVENLLTFLKVKRIGTSNGKSYTISLHKRIELLPNKHKELKPLLLALKWLGNAGSHAKKEVSMDDVMDAYDIMSVVLSELFENKKEKANKLAKQINKKKGPK